FLVEEDKRLDMHLVGFDGSALTRAARAGHVEVVKYLLDKGVDINQYSKTALQLAAFRGHLAVVEELIRRGADVNKADVHGHTPLMVAVLSRQNGLEIVKALVEQGKADLTKMDRKGKTALASARVVKSRTQSGSSAGYIQKIIDYLVSKNAPE
ncbi:MAG: ankyrin repeat domain-containing protein, partial [Ekhidna sp.]|nr:ankyrin repeat domain-containing protein [Ekhidna sp.]